MCIDRALNPYVYGKARTSAGGAVIPQVLHSPGLAHGIRAAVKFLAGVALTRPPRGWISHFLLAQTSWRVGRPPGQPPRRVARPPGFRANRYQRITILPTTTTTTTTTGLVLVRSMTYAAAD